MAYQCASLYKWTQHVGKIGSKCYDSGNCNEKILGYYQGKTPKQIHDNVRKEEEKILHIQIAIPLITNLLV